MDNQMHLEHELDRRKQSFYCLSCTETLVDWWLSMICYIMITEIHDVHLFCIIIVSTVPCVLNFFLARTTIRESVIINSEVRDWQYTFYISVFMYLIISCIVLCSKCKSISKHKKVLATTRSDIYHAAMSANLCIL